MSTVQQIVDRIADFALDEVDSDNDLEQRILNDVNDIYNRVFTAMSKNDFGRYTESESVTITSGTGTNTANIRVLSVYDVDNNRILEKTDVFDLEKEYPALDKTGNPCYYYLDGNTTINTYPINDTTLRVRYFPKVNTLAIDDAESAIKIPTEYHDVLELGGIWLMAIREQGFHDRLDRREKENAYMKRLKKLISYVRNESGEPKRVPYDD